MVCTVESYLRDKSSRACNVCRVKGLAWIPRIKSHKVMKRRHRLAFINRRAMYPVSAVYLLRYLQGLRDLPWYEKKIGGCQTRIKRICNDSLRRWRQAMILEMGQRSVYKSILNTLTADSLLPHTCNHLRNIKWTSCGPWCCHDARGIWPWQCPHCLLTGGFT